MELLARITYLALLLIMVVSGLWVAYDVKRRGKPVWETALWGIFAFWFIGLGLMLYIFWRKRFADY